jgi:membrane associated rhomboid family serine protease
MAETVAPSFEEILRLCAATAPQPWYPSAHAKAAGIDRDRLDLPLERLRLGGLIRLTDWVQGQGQGYVLTPEGEQALQQPHMLARLRNGDLPRARPPANEPPLRPLPNRARSENTETIEQALQSSARPVVTQALLWANILFFVYGFYLANKVNLPGNIFMAGGSKDPQAANAYNGILATSGAIFGPYILQGEWWRLLTCCFVHIGLLHLGMNMLLLYMLGPLLERMWGSWRFLAIYLLSGLGGSMAAVLFNPTTLTAGASGALWGMMTSLGTWLVLNRDALPEGVAMGMLRRLTPLFLLNVLISFSANVSGAGHFGGGLAGVLLSVPMNAQRLERGLTRWLGLAGVVTVAGLGWGFYLWYQSVDPWWQRARADLQRQQAARAEAQQAKKEHEHFVAEYEPAIKKATAAAGKVFDEQVKPLLALEPADRPTEKVQQVRAAANREKEALTEVAHGLEKADPPTDPRLRATLQAGRRYVTAYIDLLDLALAALLPSEDWAAKAEAVNKQAQVMGSLGQRWRNALR